MTKAEMLTMLDDDFDNIDNVQYSDQCSVLDKDHDFIGDKPVTVQKENGETVQRSVKNEGKEGCVQKSYDSNTDKLTVQKENCEKVQRSVKNESKEGCVQKSDDSNTDKPTVQKGNGEKVKDQLKMRVKRVVLRRVMIATLISV